MGNIVRRIVHPVGLSASASTGIVPSGQAWDVYIGGIPFMLNPTGDFPFRIKAIGQTLYRYDTSNQAGEQTLGAWWLRSQTSFHGGAGQTFLDGTDPTISADIQTLRFNTSQGVDVWTPGEVKLLSDVDSIYSSATSGMKMLCALDGATNVSYIADGTALKRYDGATTNVTWGGAGTILSLTQDGSNYLAADSTGVYRGALSGANGSLLWNTGSSDVIITWVKQRLMAAIGDSIYELTGGKIGTPTELTVTCLDAWQASHAYTLGAVVNGGNGHWFKVTTAGTSAATAPTWPTSSGGTVTDGTVTWTEQGATATYAYRVSAVTDTGETLACAEQTVTGPATLSADTPAKLTWTKEDGASSYNVYGRTSGAELLIDNASATSYSDDGTGTPSGALPSANTTATLPDPKFTGPTGWTWDALADGPEAIYAAGHRGSQSVIYKFVLDASGGVPALTTGIAAVTLPEGVVVRSLVNHSDSWLAIGTDQGLYVGQFASGGDVSISLLRLDLGGSVAALAAHERFVYAPYTASDGNATLARVDLSFDVKPGLNAWAPDLRANAAGSVTQIGMFGDKVMFLVDGVGVYKQSDDYLSSGTITTSRVRFDTSESKIFDSVRWHGEGPGTLACFVAVNKDTDGRNIGSLTASTVFDSMDTPILAPGGTFATMTFKLSTSDTTKTPKLNGWLLKALPMQSRSYQILLPLSCYDEEKLGNGDTFGHTGWSLERVDAIMRLADQQKSQVLQQIAGPKSQRRALRVVIDDFDYIQTSPPRTSTRTGGLLYLTLRTV